MGSAQDDSVVPAQDDIRTANATFLYLSEYQGVVKSRIILYVNILQKQNVRGPFTEERLSVRDKASTGEKGP